VNARRLALLAAPAPPAYALNVGLVIALALELLALTVGFDTQSLLTVPSVWALLVGWTPQILRLTTTAALVSCVLAGARQPDVIRSLPWTDASPLRVPALGLHAIALVLFAALSAVVLNGRPPFLAHPALWTLAWAGVGVVTIVAWGLALFSFSTWRSIARQSQPSIVGGVVAGIVIWASGFLSEALWRSLARYTFNMVAWTLRLFYSGIVSNPQTLTLGTSRFTAIITPPCSGYEGIGLVVAFLSVYLWCFRQELKFPGALVLLPLAALTAWLVNALRIVALIALGTAGWKDIARGGFHSQAGWIAFNLIALAFVALTMRFRVFTNEAAAPTARAARDDRTTAYLAPFLAITATAMLTGAVSAGFDWLYPTRLVAAAAVLWTFRKTYRTLNWTWSWWPVAIGCAAFVIWLALVPASSTINAAWPQALQSAPWYWAAAWLVCRTVGYVMAAPLAEELAFRGFLTRWLVQADFDRLPLGMFTWASFVISSVLFGLFHGALWLPGTLAGMLFALALYRRGAFGDAVQAHATTNGLLALYAFATGHWWVWS
jgi:exosortase E/protease (VPEID-CTERM system)